jgi:hypothetical protein
LMNVFNFKNLVTVSVLWIKLGATILRFSVIASLADMLSDMVLHVTFNA